MCQFLSNVKLISSMVSCTVSWTQWSVCCTLCKLYDHSFTHTCTEQVITHNRLLHITFSTVWTQKHVIFVEKLILIAGLYPRSCVCNKLVLGATSPVWYVCILWCEFLSNNVLNVNNVWPSAKCLATDGGSLLLSCQRMPTPPNFVERTFANGHKTMKLTKVFSLECFPLYGGTRGCTFYFCKISTCLLERFECSVN